MKNLEVLCMLPDNLLKRKTAGYVDNGLPGFLEKLAFGPNLILKGFKGNGKNSAIEVVAERLGAPLLSLNCCDETGNRDLCGSMVADGVFQLGMLPMAVELANKEGACILLLDEINTLPPTSQKILNSMADFRQEIMIPRIGQVFRVDPGKKIWIIGTMNPNYGGTYSLNEDLRSRFQAIDVPFLPVGKEREVLHKRFAEDSMATAVQRRNIDLLLNLAGETRGGALDYALSTRDLVQCVDNYIQLGDLALSLKLLEGKYEGDAIKDFQARVQSLYNINLSEVKLFG